MAGSSYRAPISTVSPEQIVRPFQTVLSGPVSLLQPAPVTVIEDLEGEVIEWGEASRFVPAGATTDDPIVINLPNYDADRFDPFKWDVRPYTGTVGDLKDSSRTRDWEDDGEDQEEGPEESDPVYEYRETMRRTSTVRITNPEDEEQYVDVERIEVIEFRGPEGERVRFTLNNESS